MVGLVGNPATQKGSIKVRLHQRLCNWHRDKTWRRLRRNRCLQVLCFASGRNRLNLYSKTSRLAAGASCNNKGFNDASGWDAKTSRKHRELRTLHGLHRRLSHHGLAFDAAMLRPLQIIIQETKRGRFNEKIVYVVGLPPKSLREVTNWGYPGPQKRVCEQVMELHRASE